jgi:4-hydroxybenzoate polyprenyltransferase
MTEVPINLITFIDVLFCFIGCVLVSSANYTINEWLDRGFDEKHPIKKFRTSVISKLNWKLVYSQYIFLAFTGLGILYFQNTLVFLLGLFLIAMGIVYNVEPFRLKDKAVIDVLTESINNPIRMAVGWYATESAFVVPASLVLSAYGFGIFLMTLKRFAELKILKDAAVSYRVSFENWNEVKLLTVSLLGVLVGSIFLGIFMVLWRIELVVAIPFLILLIIRYFSLSITASEIAISPEKLYKTPSLIFLALLFSLVVLSLTAIDIQYLRELMVIRR